LRDLHLLLLEQVVEVKVVTMHQELPALVCLVATVVLV
jgi:hypothetical protein